MATLERRSKTIIAADLNPEAKVWAAFVKTNLLPTTHDTTLLADKVLLVYAIIMNLSIDDTTFLWACTNYKVLDAS